jgi:plastocyanin
VTTTPLPRRLRGCAALAAVLAAAVLTGCGSSETPAAAGTSAEQPSASSPPASSPSPSAPADDTPAVSTLEAALVDFAVEMPETELSAGTYTIAVANDGGASHDLVVEGPDGEDVAASDILAPGESGTVEVVLEPGEYVFYCSVGTHRAMGMELVVTVV